MLRFKHAPGDIINGQFKVISALKTGGMSSVYRVMDIKINATYACKEMDIVSMGSRHDISRNDLLGAFANEAHAAASLTHPHIPHAFYMEDPLRRYICPECGSISFTNKCPENCSSRMWEADKRCYLLFEYLQGFDLEELAVQRKTPFPYCEAKEWFLQAAGAMAYMHSNGICHRDIKPDNIMVEKSSGAAFLVDLGIAAAEQWDSFINTSISHKRGFSLEAWGTRGYVPADKRLSAGILRDIYSFGMTIYRLVSGLDPKKSDELMLMKESKPSAISADINAALEKVILKSLGKLDGLYTSSEEFVDDLEKIDKRCGKEVKTSASKGAYLKIAYCDKYDTIDEKYLKMNYLKSNSDAKLEFIRLPEEIFLDECIKRNEAGVPFDIILCNTGGTLMNDLTAGGLLCKYEELNNTGVAQGIYAAVCKGCRSLDQAKDFVRFFCKNK